MKHPDAAAATDHPAVPRKSLPAARAYLFDWDGCIAVGNEVLPAARSLLAKLADRAAIVSNNSTHLPSDLHGWLQRAGIDIPPARILLAGAEAIHWAAAQKGARVLLFAASRLRAYAREQGVEIVRERPDIVLVLRDTRFTYAKLERAVDAVSRGAQLVAANGDLTHPGPAGRPVPETGALVTAIATCVPNATPLLLGKPSPTLFQAACTALGVTPGEALMIGDNPDTDLAGARAIAMPALLIGVGAEYDIGMFDV